MARRKTLTDNMIAKEKPGSKRRTLPDPELRGHYVRITPKGAKSFVAVARDPDGKQVWATLGGTDVLTIAGSRESTVRSAQPPGGPAAAVAVRKLPRAVGEFHWFSSRTGASNPRASFTLRVRCPTSKPRKSSTGRVTSHRHLATRNWRNSTRN